MTRSHPLPPLHAVLVVLALLAPGLAGCSERRIRADATRVADIAGRAFPFAELTGVTLGMPRAALLTGRPDAIEDPHGSLMEVVYGDTLIYRMGEDPEQPLVAVELGRILPVADSVAPVMWEQLVAELARGRSGEGRCYRAASGALAAAWTASAHAVAALVDGRHLRVVVTTRLDAVLPGPDTWAPLPCP